MKNLIYPKYMLFFIGVVSAFSSCTKDDLPIVEEDNLTNNIQALEVIEILTTADVGSKIYNNQWNVQTLGKTFKGISNDSRIKRRFRNENGKLWMKVVAGDGTTPNSRYSRTELRSVRGNFSTQNYHRLDVAMNVPKSSSNVIIGQIFDESANDDFGIIYLKNRKLYVQFEGQRSVKLSNGIGDSVSYSITTDNGVTTISAKNESVSSSEVRNNCYFKAGAYLRADTGSATVEITSLSQL